MIIKRVVLFIFIILFSACSIKEKAIEVKEKSLIGMDNQIHSVNKTVVDGEVVLKEYKTTLDNTFFDLKTTLLQNEYLGYIIPDEYIINNRQDLILYSGNMRNYSYNEIMNKVFDKKRLSVNKNSMPNSEKFKLLSEYFVEKAKENYINKFKISNKMPIYDKYISASENVSNINEYKLKLYEYEKLWKVNFMQTKKYILSEVLDTMYGEFNYSKITYNPNSEEMYINVKSQRNGFNIVVIIDVSNNIAKEIIKNKSLLSSSAYFTLDGEDLYFVGMIFKYKNQDFLAKNSDSQYEHIPLVEMSYNAEINLESLSLDYKEVIKNIKPPVWFYSLEKIDNEYIGYGVDENIDEAKKSALNEIAQTIEVKLSSESSFSKQIQGDASSKEFSSNIKLKTKDLVLKDAEVIKVEKFEGLWWVGMKYTKH